MPAVGYIPERIVFIYGRPHDKKIAEDLLESAKVPAFVCAAENKKSRENGKNWVRSSFRFKKTPYNLLEDEERNGPFTGIRICGLEKRAEGGRAYKALLPNTHYVDLREDVLLDTLMSVGISPGGVLNGEFVFASVSSQFKIVRVGSQLHAELVKSTEGKFAKKISNRDLKVGNIYEARSGATSVYLGKVKTIEIVGDRWSGIRGMRKPSTFHLWFEIISSYNYGYYGEKGKKPPQEKYDHSLKEGSALGNFELKKTHNFIYDKGESNLSFNIDDIKRAAKKYFDGIEDTRPYRDAERIEMLPMITMVDPTQDEYAIPNSYNLPIIA